MAVALQILASGFAAGAVPPHRVAVAVQPPPSGRNWTTTILLAAGLLLAAAAGLAVWVRS